jgi:glycosyltransferase involved in cell wall biosynthesis
VTDRSEPILSVLVPTYNYSAYIGAAVSSVLDQAVAGVEIVIADDGSTDDTQEVLRPLIEAGAVRYVCQPNRGPSAARNLAMASARGRLLMLLDADDVLMPGCLATTLAFLERHPEAGLFFTNYDIFDETGVLVASGVDSWSVFRSIPHRQVEPEGWLFSESLTPHIIRHGAFMHTSGLTLRREVAERAGPFREGYCYAEDDEFYARAAYLCTAGYVDRVLSRKRNHPRSLIHDAANRLRNSRHLLELTEIQLAEYRDDPTLVRLLRKKVKRCAESYCWGLVEARRLSEARSCLRQSLARSPFQGALYGLMLKVILLEMAGSRKP